KTQKEYEWILKYENMYLSEIDESDLCKFVRPAIFKEAYEEYIVHEIFRRLKENILGSDFKCKMLDAFINGSERHFIKRADIQAGIDELLSEYEKRINLNLWRYGLSMQDKIQILKDICYISTYSSC
ncbi:MAG: hypothetical protein WC996_03640, partial [Peptostreptococcales bacterium]